VGGTHASDHSHNPLSAIRTTMSQADYENSEQVAGLSINACLFSLSTAYAPFSGFALFRVCLRIPNPPFASLLLVHPVAKLDESSLHAFSHPLLLSPASSTLSSSPISLPIFSLLPIWHGIHLGLYFQRENYTHAPPSYLRLSSEHKQNTEFSLIYNLGLSVQ
jgi:hypothetical protein